MRTNRALLAISLLCLASGCQLAQQPDFGRPHVEVLPVPAGTEPGVTDEVTSREIQLVADNQFRYTGGEGTVLTMALVDACVRSHDSGTVTYLPPA